MSETKAKSFKTLVVPAMMTGTTTLEEEMTNMKAILEKFTRDSIEKEACNKFQEENITKLTRNLEKWPVQSSSKDSESEDLEKESIHTEASNNEK